MEKIKRPLDRSHCFECGTLLSRKNAYPRQDTTNHLHARCKKCYIKVQKARLDRYVKPEQKPYILIRVGGKKHKVFFESESDKQEYIRQRRSMNKFSRSNDSKSSRVGCTEDWNTGELLMCDQCGGIMRYNSRGELECGECHLISDTMPISLERVEKIDMTAEHYNFYMNDTSCVDTYYSKAYSKYSK